MLAKDYKLLAELLLPKQLDTANMITRGWQQRKHNPTGNCLNLNNNLPVVCIECCKQALTDRRQLMTSFVWELTPQGHRYWSNIMQSGGITDAKWRSIVRKIIWEMTGEVV